MPHEAMPDLSADLRRLLELMNQIRDRLGEFSQVDSGEVPAASKIYSTQRLISQASAVLDSVRDAANPARECC